MQQNASASQQVLQTVTTLQNQIPVARYVSVITGKSDSVKTVGNIIKPIQTHQRSAATLRTALIRGELGDGSISIEMKQQPASALAVDEVGEVFTVIKTPSQHQRQQQQVHVQGSQQLYSGNSLQYVDSSGDHVYSNGSTANNFQYTGTNQLYTNSQQSNDVYFDSSTASAHVGSQATVSSTQHLNSLGVTGSSGNDHQSINQLISSPGGSTYLIQGAANEGGIVAMPISHSSRASPATVQWLMEHFESAEGVSLPRALMYNHYLLHCQEQNLDPVNAASYGKLVRSVFVGLRTRRLGTRGNSKYHYYGIRIKANSPLNRLHDDLSYIAMRQQPTSRPKNFKTMNCQSADKPRDSASSSINASMSDQVQQQAQQHQQYLGDATQALPDFDPIQVTSDDDPMPDNVTQEDLMGLEDLYRDHCANVLDIIVSLQFSVVETIWKTFWRAKVDSEDIQASQNELETKLSRQKLILLCQWPPVQRWIRDSDHQMYQSLVEVLIPDVLRPIPSALTLAIRNFAKGLETCLANVLDKCDLSSELIKIKLTAVSAFSQTLRRYTSLNHLAQAARAVMNDSALTNQMLVDLNRVDFNNVQEQASWVCQCEDSTVRELEGAFKAALSEHRSLENWADWLETVVVKVLKQHEKDPERYTEAARQFLLKWCFYSSMVIRDLTLRSAVSFGSFHLIRLLYDEYMFYLVEHRVAHTTGETAIAVMSEFSSHKTGRRPAVAVSPASTTSDLSSNRSPAAAFVASALISNSSNQISKQAVDRGIKRSASEMETRVLSVVQVNGKFPSITNNSAKIDSSNSG